MHLSLIPGLSRLARLTALSLLIFTNGSVREAHAQEEPSCSGIKVLTLVRNTYFENVRFGAFRGQDFPPPEAITLGAGENRLICTVLGGQYGVWTDSGPPQLIVWGNVPLIQMPSGNYEFLISSSYIQFANFTNEAVKIYFMQKAQDTMAGQAGPDGVYRPNPVLPPGTPAEFKVSMGELGSLEQYVQGATAGGKWIVERKSDGKILSELVAPLFGTRHEILPEIEAATGKRTVVLRPPFYAIPQRSYGNQTYIMTHNAASPLFRGVDARYQTLSLYDQLDAGARAMELDVHMWDAGDGQGSQLYFCHGDYGACGATRTSMFGLLQLNRFSEGLKEIVRFLDAYPTEPVTLFLEVKLPQETDKTVSEATKKKFLELYGKALNDAGASKHLRVPYINERTVPGFHPNRIASKLTELSLTSVLSAPLTVGKKGRLGEGFDWPAVQDMKNRLVIFSDQELGKREGFDLYQSIVPHTWTYVRENDYGQESDRDKSLLGPTCDTTNATAFVPAPFNTLTVTERRFSRDGYCQIYNFLNAAQQIAGNDLGGNLADWRLFRFNHFPASMMARYYNFTAENEAWQVLARLKAYVKAGYPIPNFIAVDHFRNDSNYRTLVDELNKCWLTAENDPTVATCVSNIDVSRQRRGNVADRSSNRTKIVIN